MSKTDDLKLGVVLAVKACSPQTFAELAQRLGVSSQAVQQWKRVPPERVPSVAAATGVPRWLLRPDLYEKPEPRGRAA